jgi:integrase
MGLITFENAVDDLLNDYQIKKRKTLADAKRRVTLHLRPAFGGQRLISLTTDRIRAYIAARQAVVKQEDGSELPGAEAATINRELALLKRMFTLAVQAGKLHGKPHIPMLREDNIRRGFFEPGQFEAVRAALPVELRSVVTFAYITGWRLKSEVLPLEWRQVDWTGRAVRLDPGTTKNGEGRTFPFTSALEALLKERLVEHEALKKANRLVPLVFHRDGIRIRDLRRAWETACEAAGCPGRIPHDFRRTAVRN